MTTRSYSDLSDSATTFDPEEQFDRDIDERMKGMSKEEAVARELAALITEPGAETRVAYCMMLAHAAIATADKWDAEQQTLAAATDLLPRQHLDPDKWPSRSNISAGQDAAIQDELDHPPASIMEEGK